MHAQKSKTNGKMVRFSLFLAALPVASAVAPVEMTNAVSFMKDVLASQHLQQRRRAQEDDMMGNGGICDSMGGTMIDDTECQLCPSGNEDAGCCAIDLESFDFSCDVCETIGGTQECGKCRSRIRVINLSFGQL